jgi:hypothetical protein
MWLARIFGRVKNYDSNIVSRLKQDKRKKICQGCKYYSPHFKALFKTIKDVPQCKSCKCAILSKVIFEDEKCPIKKW